MESSAGGAGGAFVGVSSLVAEGLVALPAAAAAIAAAASAFTQPSSPGRLSSRASSSSSSRASCSSAPALSRRQLLRKSAAVSEEAHDGPSGPCVPATSIVCHISAPPDSSPTPSVVGEQDATRLRVPLTERIRRLSGDPNRRLVTTSLDLHGLSSESPRMSLLPSSLSTSVLEQGMLSALYQSLTPRDGVPHRPRSAARLLDLAGMSQVTSCDSLCEERGEESASTSALADMFADQACNNFDGLQQLHQLSSDSSHSQATNGSGGLKENKEATLFTPPKAVIQEDVRRGGGRFRLVRKRGRSEVWNLFGQVLDTVTNVRLPYVACYACKVLYTDTGGGTGNMTRHRCPLGNSYRSVTGSSTENSEQGLLVPSLSIDSSAPPRQPPPQIRADSATPETKPLPSLLIVAPEEERNLNPQLPVDSRSPVSLTPTTLLQSSSSSAASLLLQQLHAAACAGTPLVHPTPVYKHHFHESGDDTLQAEPVPQLVAQSSAEATLGDVDKEALTNAMVRACVLDLLNPAVFEGAGMRALIENLFRRNRLQSRSFDRQSSMSVDVLPHTATFQQTLDVMLRSAVEDVKAEMAFALKGSRGDVEPLRPAGGVVLSAEKFEYANESRGAIWASYVTNDWRLHSSVIRVRSLAKSSMGAEVVAAVEEYGLVSACQRLIVTAKKPEDIETASPIFTALRDVTAVLNEVLEETFRGCLEVHRVRETISRCRLLVCGLSRLGLLRLLQKSIPVVTSEDDLDLVLHSYPLLLACRQQLSHIQFLLEQHEDGQELSELIGQTDWGAVDEIADFLQSFHDMALGMTDLSRPNAHLVLPEWCALQHECGADEEDDGRRLLRALRKRAFHCLDTAKSQAVSEERRIATVLSPRFRALYRICDEEERKATYARIRELTNGGSSPSPKEERGADGEPANKRRSFLIALEEGSADDELGAYLVTQFSFAETKDVLNFWGSHDSQFPRLARLARVVFSVPSTVPSCRVSTAATVPPDQLNSFLILRSVYEGNP